MSQSHSAPTAAELYNMLVSAWYEANNLAGEATRVYIFVSPGIGKEPSPSVRITVDSADFGTSNGNTEVKGKDYAQCAEELGRRRGFERRQNMLTLTAPKPEIDGELA